LQPPTYRTVEMRGYEQLATQILALSREGLRDQDIATRLAALGYRSARQQTLTKDLVGKIRRAHGVAILWEYGRHLAGECAFLVAAANRFPVGQVWADVTAERPEGAGVISALRVIPCLQGLGVGTRLIAAAERVMKDRGLTAAEIGVEQDNRRARRLYERLRYAVLRDNYEPDHARGGFWERILVKPLD
jgi:ribosomal protein S18 acetylase RimI-like enzyme